MNLSVRARKCMTRVDRINHRSRELSSQRRATTCWSAKKLGVTTEKSGGNGEVARSLADLAFENLLALNRSVSLRFTTQSTVWLGEQVDPKTNLAATSARRDGHCPVGDGRHRQGPERSNPGGATGARHDLWATLHHLRKLRAWATETVARLGPVLHARCGWSGPILTEDFGWFSRSFSWFALKKNKVTEKAATVSD